MDNKRFLQRAFLRVAIAVLLAALTVYGVVPTSLATEAETVPPTPAPQPEPLPIAKQELPFSELAPTTTMTFEELVGDNGIHTDENASKLPPLPPADKYKLVVDEYHQFATVYQKSANGEYTVPVRYIIVSTGTRTNHGKRHL